MKKFIVITLATFFTFFGIGNTLHAQAQKTLLAVGTKNDADNFSNWVKTLGIAAESWAQPVDPKKPSHLRLPPAETLKKYDMVVLVYGQLTKESKEAYLAYVNGGGKFLWCYNSLEGTKWNTGELGFGTTGFDGIIADCHTPYNPAKPVEVTVKLQYAPDFCGGKERSASFVYSNFAIDLMDAKALIFNKEKPERALATVAVSGKGQVYFHGLGTRDDIQALFRYAGLIR